MFGIKIEFNINTDNESVLVKRVVTQDGDYDESEVEEGPRFSKSKAKKRASSTIPKKTPRNSSNSKFRSNRNTHQSGINCLINRKFSESNSFMRPPSVQKTHRSFISNFSLHSSNISRIKNDLSRCNIPKPHRYSFRESNSNSNIVNISGNIDKYSLLKSDYESLKEELGQRNATILKMQIEMKELKTKFFDEKDALITKIERANNDKSEDFSDLHIKLDGVIKENEDLSKKLYHRDLENKQNMINKNQAIKLMQREI